MKARLIATILAVLCAAPVSAATLMYDVASDSSTGVATTFDLAVGQTFSVNVIDRADTWILGATPREFTADGMEISGADYGNFGAFRYGTLVGRIGAGDAFAIGFGDTFMAATSGILSLLNWDSAYGDNSGSIAVNVTSAVPVPAGGLLLLSALGLGGLAARKRRKSA
ncbi:hypothetical protein [Loktanella sp. M215]|uniref:hypothetical protein n=1 Tax=Loktanella sp. M215 TaxID=2675431 RepID=UPI001F226303|nr:hypothetical protein [Loktanella sp. M215]MCF7702110.1 hypothetical protein [Loktanella sp. M215]